MSFLCQAEGKRIGFGFSATAQLGPVESKRHFDGVMGFIHGACRARATALTGGDRPRDAGCFIKPTV